jgi:hypothetical protein
MWGQGDRRRRSHGTPSTAQNIDLAAFGHVKKAMIPVSSRGCCLSATLMGLFVYAVVWFAHKEMAATMT